MRRCAYTMVTAGMLSLALPASSAVLPGGFVPGRQAVFAGENEPLPERQAAFAEENEPLSERQAAFVEENEPLSERQAAETETELMDALITGVEQFISEDPGQGLFAEGVNDIAQLLAPVLPLDLKEDVAAMSEEEISEYAVMIEKILRSPDFQSLIQYEEVQDLIATLVKNALEFAEDDPETTDKILETMGVDRRAIMIFFMALQPLDEHKETTDKVDQFLKSEQGRELRKLLISSFTPDKIDKVLDGVHKALGK